MRHLLPPQPSRLAVRNVAALLLALVLALPLAPSASATGPTSVADLAEKLLGSVVNISTRQNVGGTRGPSRGPSPRAPDGSPFQEFFDDFFQQGPRRGPGGPRRRGPNRRGSSLGSGFVIDADGFIVTNNHVIAEADEITVEFTDGSKLKAEVVGVDKKTDIAVLKVEPTKPLKAVPFGNSGTARIGDWVMAIGNPFGQGGTVTLGIISATKRDIRSGPYDNFIQTDASINRGNSGGPLFNMDGEVIGINTAIISPSGGSIGIGFSIPSNLATGVIRQLREFGETRRGWLGVSIQPVTPDIAESLGMDNAQGALVAGLTPGGPAERSKLKTGDVIVTFDGKPIRTLRELPRVVAETPVGKEVDVVVLRKGNRETVGVTLGRLEDGERLALNDDDDALGGNGDDDGSDAPAAPTSTRLLGLTLNELTDEARERFSLGSDAKGVLIEEVAENSAAYEKGVRAGNLVVEVAQEEVSTPDDVRKRVKSLRDGGRKNALLLIANASGDLQFVVLRIE